MSRVRENLRLLYVACATCALAVSLPAESQEAGLRGAVGEAEVISTLLPPSPTTDPGTTGATGMPDGQYVPTDADALPREADEDGTLFPGPDEDPFATSQDPFPPLDPRTPRRRPSTAIERERERDRARDPASPEQEAEAPDQEAEAEEDDAGAGTIRVSTVDAAADEASDTPVRMNERVLPIEGLARRREDDPYAPLGLRVGTFTVVPTLEQGLTWTSNADSSPDGEEAILSESTLRLNAVSDWSRHRAVMNGFGTYRKSISGDEVSEFEGGADAALELDFAHGYTGRAALAYSVGRESAASPVAIAGVDRQPLRHTIDGSLGLEKSLGKARFGITGEVSRDQYGDARLEDGSILSQEDRDATLVLVRLRGGYALSPAILPFVEVEGGRRFYDEEYDSAGYERSATRLGARAGLSLDMSEKLAGEVSAGWIAENFDDDRLETVSGLALAAALDWSPVRGTNVRLDASTEIEGDSGSLLYAGTLRVQRAMRSNLTGDAALGVAWRDYAGGGHDLILSGEASLTWWLNRYAGITARARHERQTSTLPGRDYETTSVFMGVKLQR